MKKENIILLNAQNRKEEIENIQARYLVNVYGLERVFKTGQDVEMVNYLDDATKSLKKGYLVKIECMNNQAVVNICKLENRLNRANKLAKNNKQRYIFDTRKKENINVIYNQFYTIIDTKNPYISDMNIASFDSLEEVANFFGTSANYINRCINGQVLINDRYQVFKDCLLFEDVFSRKEAC